jgi:hypothetical protein
MKHPRAITLAVLSTATVASLAVIPSPASAATSWSVVDDNGVILANVAFNPDNPDRVTICDAYADGLPAVIEYYTATNPTVQRRFTTWVWTCTVGFAPGETLIAIKGTVGTHTTGWQKIG